MKLKTIAILLTTVLMQSCATTNTTTFENKTILVGGYKTECETGRDKRECLMVSYETDLAEAKWEYFHGTFENFAFEPGILQKIKVKTPIIPRGTPVEERFSPTYTVVKVLKRSKDVRWNLQGDWTLTSISDVDVEQNKETPRISFDLTKNRVSGNNGCNNFGGIIHDVASSTIKLERTLGTLRACIDMPLADQFDVAFDKIRSYKIADNQLQFFDARGNMVFTFSKTLLSTADTRIHDIWVAIKINGKEVPKREEMPRMELNLNTMQLFGNNGCNEYAGKITLATEKKITFGPVATTRKMCRDMELPAKFDKALQQAASYKYEKLHLKIYDEKGKELITLLKVD
ncbi:META domain-containing protein [Flavobacterium sp. SM2513]|uniref:META domain-containing protein n=1 Tax=Flavobacterium sp. SM2513 TaxID=3424766 RepID=UPI003D7F1D99